MNQAEFFSTLVSYGVPANDASLIGYGAMKKKSFTWQNDEQVNDAAINSTNEFLGKLNAGIKVSAYYGKFGRIIWEIKALQ